MDLYHLQRIYAFFICVTFTGTMFVLYISGITVFTLVTLFWHILQKYYIFQNQMLCVFVVADSAYGNFEMVYSLLP